ncbi:MAG: helix-turn-helix transcriptional regulator [Clostridia bacterium]|nr:helix-turn-helix transcriptional regulator [Clostridia bacterium]
MIEDFDGLREVVHFEKDLLLRIYRNCEAEDYPRHWHTDFELIMPLSAGYTVLIDNREYALTEGDILLIPPGVIHSLKAPERGERLIVQVSCVLANQMHGFYDELRHFYPCLHVRKVTPMLEDVCAFLQQTMLEMYDEYMLRGPLFNYYISARCTQMFITLARNRKAFITHESDRRYAKSVDGFLRVCDYIHNHCHEKLDVEMLSAVAGYSKSHFVRMFKEFADVSCVDYIQQQRVALAKQLLMDPENSIMDIVTRSGFGSVASFNRVFKQLTGQTPTQYRKTLRQNNRNI